MELLIKYLLYLSNIANGFNHNKCISLSNQKCMTQPTRINLHTNEYSRQFHYCPFAVKLNRCVGICNTINDSSRKVCVLNKTEVLNLSMFNMITGKNQSKILAKDISCKCKCKFDRRNVIQIDGGITINADASTKNIKVKQTIFEILLHVVSKTLVPTNRSK